MDNCGREHNITISDTNKIQNVLDNQSTEELRTQLMRQTILCVFHQTHFHDTLCQTFKVYHRIVDGLCMMEQHRAAESEYSTTIYLLM